jgi:hypothetical protein
MGSARLSLASTQRRQRHPSLRSYRLWSDVDEAVLTSRNDIMTVLNIRICRLGAFLALGALDEEQGGDQSAGSACLPNQRWHRPFSFAGPFAEMINPQERGKRQDYRQSRGAPDVAAHFLQCEIMTQAEKIERTILTTRASVLSQLAMCRSVPCCTLDTPVSSLRCSR